MEKITFSTEVGGIILDACIDTANFCKAYNVIELLQKGKHFEYVFRNKETGECFLGEDSKLTPADLKKLYPSIERYIRSVDVKRLAE